MSCALYQRTDTHVADICITFSPNAMYRSLLYFAQLHSSIIIVLKASLKWVPVVGPAMQMFRFIFMQRNWNADKVNLGRVLSKFGEHAGRSFDPFVLLFCEFYAPSPTTNAKN